MLRSPVNLLCKILTPATLSGIRSKIMHEASAIMQYIVKMFPNQAQKMLFGTTTLEDRYIVQNAIKDMRRIFLVRLTHQIRLCLSPYS